MNSALLYAQLMNRYAPLSRDTLSPVGMGWGQKGHLQIQAGMTIQSIELITDITDASKVKRVSLELNGEEIVALTGAEIVMIQAFKKTFAEAGRYIIDFADKKYRTKNGIRSGELVTLPTDEVNLFVELVDDVDGPSFSIRGRTWVTPAQPQRYFVPRIYGSTYDAAMSGDNDLIWKNGNMNRFIRRVHFKAADINRVQIWRDDTKRHDLRAVDNNYDLKANDLAPQAGYFHFDPTQLGLGLDGLFPTFANTQLKFVLTKAASGAVPMLVEMLEQVRPLPVRQA
ncbi:major capsid protein P2 [Shewanella psychrotolerans]|uniref:major capsid protein P2 n=1 Tax=Shewanella psychrotolerans TaxID=2864206 RepID=UPI001C65A9AB|nr:major capsid protein P2 [Shewanella psychrotolerans]QYK03132.1 hypothetical protein K0I62_09530 [Shewanella psychrotolerans]